LRAFGVPVRESDADWESIATELQINSPTVARSVLLLEREPSRPVRPETFDSVVTREDHFFGTPVRNCPYQCEYCYLYANSDNVRPVVVFTEIEPLLQQVQAVAARFGRDVVFNFGEDGDSLALEHLTGHAAELIRFFAQQGTAQLELRTKAGLRAELLSIPNRRRTTIAASVMPGDYARRYEHNTASVDLRISALAAYARAGYRIALKLEPALLLHGWEGAYERFLAEAVAILGTARPEHVSLGCFRYRPELDEAIRRGFPRNRLSDAAREEYLPQRYSYPGTLREQFYRFMASRLREVWPDARLYLSMESADMCSRIGADPWLQAGSLSRPDERNLPGAQDHARVEVACPLPV
jgi:spore photoproduct lyase